MVTVAVDESDEEEEKDDLDPLIKTGGGERRCKARESRVIYDNSRILVPKKRSRCSVQQACMALLGLVTSSAVVFILMMGEREEPSRKTLAPGLDYMDFKQPKNMISYLEIMEDNFSFNLSSSSDVMVFLHIQVSLIFTLWKHVKILASHTRASFLG